MVTVVLGETLILPLLVKVIGLDIGEIFNSMWLRVLLGWPTIVLLFGLAVVFFKKQKREH